MDSLASSSRLNLAAMANPRSGLVWLRTAGEERPEKARGGGQLGSPPLAHPCLPHPELTRELDLADNVEHERELVAMGELESVLEDDWAQKRTGGKGGRG